MCVCVCGGGGGGGGGCTWSAMSGCALTLLYLLMVSPVMTMLHGQSTCERGRNQYPSPTSTHTQHTHTTHTHIPHTHTHHTHSHTHIHTTHLISQLQKLESINSCQNIQGIVNWPKIYILTHIQDMQANHLMAVFGIYTYTGSESASIRSDYVQLSLQ